jgi:hypothetical protein
MVTDVVVGVTDVAVGVTDVVVGVTDVAPTKYQISVYQASRRTCFDAHPTFRA